MRANSSTRLAAFAVMVGALACAGNQPETDEAAAARDTSEIEVRAADRDTAAVETGMERDTTGAMTDTTGMTGDTTGLQTPGERSPSDTFLDQQGVGAPSDTAGYGGLERSDTTGQAGQPTEQTGDTSGYNPSQQPSQDTTSSR